jgi:hypothetical protein
MMWPSFGARGARYINLDVLVTGCPSNLNIRYDVALTVAWGERYIADDTVASETGFPASAPKIFAARVRSIPVNILLTKYSQTAQRCCRDGKQNWSLLALPRIRLFPKICLHPLKSDLNNAPFGMQRRW